MYLPDHVTIGQPFVKDETVTVIVRGNQILMFNQNDFEPIPQIVFLLSKKNKISCNETKIVPPGHMGHIEMYIEDSFDISIHFQQEQ